MTQVEKILLAKMGMASAIMAEKYPEFREIEKKLREIAKKEIQKDELQRKAKLN